MSHKIVIWLNNAIKNEEAYYSYICINTTLGNVIVAKGYGKLLDGPVTSIHSELTALIMALTHLQNNIINNTMLIFGDVNIIISDDLNNLFNTKIYGVYTDTIVSLMKWLKSKTDGNNKFGFAPISKIKSRDNGETLKLLKLAFNL